MTPDDAEEYTAALGQVVAGGYRQIALGKKLGVPAALGLSVEAWVQQRLGGYVRMSIPERREAVAELTEEGMSSREIGEVLGVDHETVRKDRRGGETSPAENPDAASTNGTSGETSPVLTFPLNEELLERQQRETLIEQLDRAVYSLESPVSTAEAEARRLLVEGDAGPFTPARFERVIAYATAFAHVLREAGIDG